MQLKISVMKHIISFVYQIWQYHHQHLFYIRQQFFYNNLTTCHKELHVFLELMDNNCVIHVIRQDILDQLREYLLLDSFH